MQATPEDISRLVKLQQADLALLKARKQFDELPQREQIRAARAKREEVLKKKAQADELKAKAAAALKKLEDEDASLVEKQHQVQQLIDEAKGDYRNVESRTKELNGIAKRRGTLEEELVTKAEELEKIEAVVAQVERALEVLRDQEEKATASFQKEGGALKAALMQLEGERATLAASLPEELADRYERAAKHCGGVAVAILNENACGACRVPIDAGRLASIKREAPLSTCPHCKRLLVVAG